MHFKHVLSVGLVLTLLVLINGFRLEASDGILSRLHHHGHCPADQNVVRLPAQDIRIETTRPRIVVNEVSASPRVRGFVHHAAPAVVPLMQAPIFATVLPLSVHAAPLVGAPTCAAPSSGNSALRALHEMEIQAGEIAKLRAMQRLEMEHLEGAQKRIHAGIAASFQSSAPLATTSSDYTQLQKSIEDLSKRISDVERLLIIHDNILKECKKK